MLASKASLAVDIAAPGVVIGALTSFFASIVSAKVGTYSAATTLTTILPFQVLFKPCSLVVSESNQSLKSKDFASLFLSPVVLSTYPSVLVSTSPKESVLKITELPSLVPLVDKLDLT